MEVRGRSRTYCSGVSGSRPKPVGISSPDSRGRVSQATLLTPSRFESYQVVPWWSSVPNKTGQLTVHMSSVSCLAMRGSMRGKCEDARKRKNFLQSCSMSFCCFSSAMNFVGSMLRILLKFLRSSSVAFFSLHSCQYSNCRPLECPAERQRWRL
jgi:hypothetical protein